ncbi:DUF1127 domain-containing protein [Xanthobacter sp. VTT E-85241]|uniref:DUF1127 domain-containing protein n=1 Tax=Roseixanthobacter finlandensis TaxID=3119922 RepID=UPI0037273B3A
MTTITAHPFRETTLFGRFTAQVSEFFAAVREARVMADRYERLRRMSDSELAQQGLTRETIPQAVANGF